jgi:hypothetical protein
MANLLSDLAQYPLERQYEDERAFAIWSMLESFREKGDLRLFPHFASKLYELHLALDNRVEAAEALCVCAGALTWDSTVVLAESHGLSEQPECDRKRALLNMAVDLFMSSDFVERALDVIGELIRYATAVSDYRALGRLFGQESECWARACAMERPTLNRFYGARFYGAAFSKYHANALFIYRRGGFFMSDQLVRDFREKFPKAKVDPRPPTEEELADRELCYVHVFNIKPKDPEGFDAYATPPDLARAGCGIKEFYAESPIRKRLAGNYGEFAEWHRQIRRYKTAVPLQGPLRRALATETALIEMTPVECAVYDTNSKTIELMQRACMYWRCIRYKIEWNQAAVSGFSMLASGIVNAAVNGGTKVFQDLFFESDLKNDLTVRKFSAKLKSAFADQLKAVNFALRVHWKVLTKEYIPLHRNIRENFGNMREVMEKAIGKIDLSAAATFGEIPSTASKEFDGEGDGTGE